MKNLIYSISKEKKDGEYKKVFSIKEMYKLNCINVLLEDGEYPFYLKEHSWYSVEELTPSKKITNIVDSNYPNFTEQVIEGTLKIKNGRLVVSHLDKQIPSIYQQQNSHIFLEYLHVDKDKTVYLIMGS